MDAPVPQRKIPESFVQMLYEYLAAQDCEPEGVLGEPWPRTEVLGLGSFPIERWVQLLERAASYLQDPLLGLHLGQTVAPRHLGVVGYLLLACDNLGIATQRLYRYQRLIYDVTPMQMRLGAEVDLVWDAEHGRPGPLVDETAITALVQTCRNLTDRPIRPLEVHFINPRPDDIAPYAAYFGCPVHFEQPETILRFPLDLIDLPMRSADPRTRAVMERQADALLRSLPATAPLLAKVRQLISRGLHATEPNIENVATALHCSPRTLQRRLRLHGTGFREELAIVRRQMAERYLLESELLIVDIALLLGYSEHSAFTRSFLRWTGTTPSEYRDRRGVSTPREPPGTR